MKKTTTLLSLMVGLAASSMAFAGKDDHVIIQEAAKNKVNVQQIAQLKDETGITLIGQITQHLKGDHYQFQDATGRIGVEIDDDLWRQANLKVGDHVRVVGEVDTHRYKPTDIEVIQIERYKHAH